MDASENSSPQGWKKPRARDCSHVFTRKKKRCETVYSQLARIFFWIETHSSVPPERMHYFSLRRCGSIMFVSFIQKALCGRHSFRGHCDATRCDWLSFVQLKSLCHCTRSLFAECISFRRRAISGAVNRKRKSNRRARSIFTFCYNFCHSFYKLHYVWFVRGCDFTL